MIQYPKNPLQLQKELPKKLTHLKEEAKIRFINRAIDLYRRIGGYTIAFDDCLYDGEAWILSYSIDSAITLPNLIAQIMEKWYFGNLSKNENVYFYRFMNIIRSQVSKDEWNDIEKYICNSENLIMKENMLVYCDYRNKLDEIEIMLEQNTNIRESA